MSKSIQNWADIPNKRSAYVSQKYKFRSLRNHEIDRYCELRADYERLYEKTYQGEIINKNNNETLQDIACSTPRYQQLRKYFFEKRKAKHIKAQQEAIIKDSIARKDFSEIMDDLKKCTEEPDPIQVTMDAINDDISTLFINSLFEMLANPENQTESDIEMSLGVHHKKICEIARRLMLSRNEKYGDSWKVLSVQSIANLCEMKLNRIAKLGEADAKTEDELLDVINYCIFGFIKLNNISIK